MNDEKYMKLAIREAKKAFAIGEVPIGCVIVSDDTVIAKAYNKRIKNKSTLAHAEILAIQKACKKIGDWRLENCKMYITLEPCPMCAGAIVQARIPEVIMGAANPKAGCAGSIVNLFAMDGLNHKVNSVFLEGELHDEISLMLKDFFKRLRTKKLMPPQ